MNRFIQALVLGSILLAPRALACPDDNCGIMARDEAKGHVHFVCRGDGCPNFVTRTPSVGAKSGKLLACDGEGCANIVSPAARDEAKAPGVARQD